MRDVDALLRPGNLPFSIALGVVLALLLVELALLLLGGAFPDVDLDPDTDLDLLAFFHLGKLPLIAILALFLTPFGLVGLAVAPSIGTAFGVVLGGLAGAATVRLGGAFLARILPREETTAMSRDAFVGHVATVVLGEGRRGHPTQAKFQDRHGQTHYVMVEPVDDRPLLPDETIVLVRRRGAVYDAVGDEPGALERAESIL